MAAGSEPEEDEQEWRFSLDDIDEMSAETEDDSPEDGTETEGNVAGSLERHEPLEPGDIDAENAVFVVLGALLVLGLLAAAFFGI